MLTWALAHHTARPPSADKAGSDPTQDILSCSNARGQSNCGGRGDGGQGTSCDETHEIQGFSSLFAFSCNLPSDHVLISYKLSMLLTLLKLFIDFHLRQPASVCSMPSDSMLSVGDQRSWKAQTGFWWHGQTGTDLLSWKQIWKSISNSARKPSWHVVRLRSGLKERKSPT
jgi:hypothetical protein